MLILFIAGYLYRKVIYIMGKYLKKFETHAQYEAYTADTANFILPNVSICDNVPNEVHYNPSSPTPPTPSHDYVEIGGIKWATMNVGANSIIDTGLYFQWADTQGYTAAQVGEGEGQKYFGENDCIYYNDGSYTKYNEGDSKITLEPTDDAVTAAWGGNWRMPTTAEFQALGTATTSAWTADYQGSGVAGLVCTDKTDSSKVLFFPACGDASYGSVVDVGSYGGFWSSSLHANVGDSVAYYLYFLDGSVGWQYVTDRYYGFPVRGVLDA